MKNLWKFFGPFFLVLTLAGSAAAAGPELVIYHTNDVHGYAFEERDQDGQLTRIGYERLKALVDADETERKLLLDAGDILHGQAFATARRGQLPAEILSLVGYDALAVGNHDFDYGVERLQYLAAKYRLKFLAANITETTPGKAANFILTPAMIRSWNGLKVGLFSLSTPETQTSTDPRNVAGLIFGSPVEAAAEAAKELRAAGVDLVIALTHLGSDEYCRPSSLTLAAQTPGLDLIVDGHSHSRLAERVKRADGGETLVVSAGAYFENVGRVYVDRKPGGGFVLQPELLSASTLAEVPPDPALSRALEALREELEAELAQVVMETPVALDGSRENIRHRSTNLGRIVCAALMEATGADAALLNSGSFRDSIAAGPVAKGQLLSVLPYGNYVYVVEISGRDLLAALNHGLGSPGSGAFPQFWGLTVEAGGASPGAIPADSVMVGGWPLDQAATYRLAINDFMHSGGDGYEVFTKYSFQEFSTLEEIFRNFVTQSSAEKLGYFSKNSAN